MVQRVGALPQFFFRLPAVSVFLPQVGVQLGISERDRGLRREQFEHCEPVRREDARRQVVLQVEHADRFPRPYQWQAQDGPRAPEKHVSVLGKRILG